MVDAGALDSAAGTVPLERFVANDASAVVDGIGVAPTLADDTRLEVTGAAALGVPSAVLCEAGANGGGAELHAQARPTKITEGKITDERVGIGVFYYIAAPSPTSGESSLQQITK